MKGSSVKAIYVFDPKLGKCVRKSEEELYAPVRMQVYARQFSGAMDFTKFGTQAVW